MTIATTDEHKAAAESLRGWASSVAPIATMRARGAGSWQEYWPALSEFGLFGVALDEEHGGLGGTVADLAVLLEQTAADLVGGPVLATALAGLITEGTVSDGTPCAVAVPTAEFTATAVGSDADGWTVTGTWDFVYGADQQTQVLVPATTEDGTRWLLIPPAAVTITPLANSDHTVPLAQVSATGAAAASSFAPSVDVTDLFVTLAVSELAGIAGWCLRTAVDYAKVREQFGKPIGSFQSIKHLCAWMLCRTELIRAVAADAAAAIDSGGAELPIAAAVAAATALDAAVDTAKDAIQVLGGIGFTWEHDAHFYLRRASALRQLLGGSARWRARVAELTRAGQRRTTGAERVLGDATADADVAAEIADIAALPAGEQPAALVRAGLVMPHWPAPYGRAADPMTCLQIAEQLRRAGLETPDLAIAGWAVPTLLRFGSQAQIDRFVRPTLHGEVIWCQLFSEPGAGSDLAALRTTAEKVDGGWVLRGQKVWTSLGSTANWGICLARTDPAVAKHRGISYFLVDMRTAGVQVRPLVQITGEDRFSEVFLDDVFVPDDCLVGALNNGWKIARTTLSAERVAMGGGGIGGALETLLDRFPPGGWGTELREDRFGALITSSIAGSLLEQRIAVATMAGVDAGAQASVRKLVGVRHRQDLAEYALELTGPEGSLDGDALKEFLLTRCLSIAGGTEQILLTVAAERILGLPRDADS
ncbi:acyl-CoA dehydrogenase [Nocardia mangyaensis]|uniref:Acyl-CoA dehydrogenase n=1 Tax=Nocardia mangyaensis TaxID=2213200 RepID=A0A1J0VLQ8_9NOCA|nr:acyl-CoA dehydrogenase [Nocardia mangyaensis]APE32952.1 acyl-CoA dehydrogenase [Nocardia mangyaensis]